MDEKKEKKILTYVAVISIVILMISSCIGAFAHIQTNVTIQQEQQETKDAYATVVEELNKYGGKVNGDTVYKSGTIYKSSWNANYTITVTNVYDINGNHITKEDYPNATIYEGREYKVTDTYSHHNSNTYSTTHYDDVSFYNGTERTKCSYDEVYEVTYQSGYDCYCKTTSDGDILTITTTKIYTQEHWSKGTLTSTQKGTETMTGITHIPYSAIISITINGAS